MNCHICSRSNNSRLPFYCRTCALNQLYPLRLENARLLLHKDALGREIADLSQHGISKDEEEASLRKHIVPSRQPAVSVAIQQTRLEEAQSTVKIKAIQSHIEILRSEIEKSRAEIRRRRSVLAQRHSDAESANYQLKERRDTALISVQNSTKRTEHLWHALHTKTAESRIFLCREAANLYGLRQKIRKRKDKIIEGYVIGGVPIADLRDMNGVGPAQLSTALSNVAHLLVLVSHYLSLRLPAEIILPHRNYPTATIFTPSASYMPRETTPNRSFSQSASNSPVASRTSESRQSSRPRPLYIDKPIPKLMKEDPAAYALFVEGTSLLAWNVSWLCRTQGLNVGSEAWEDICNVGKNMWQLLVAPPSQNLTIKRAFTGLDLQQKFKGSRDAPKTIIQRTKSFPMLGHYSHGTSHSFLGGIEGTEFMKTWKLASPTKVADKLRAVLIGEIANAEWEILEEKEWDDEGRDHSLGHTVLNHTSNMPGVALGSAEIQAGDAQSSNKPIKGEEDSKKTEAQPPSEQASPGRVKGTSGWTKLKSR